MHHVKRYRRTVFWLIFCCQVPLLQGCWIYTLGGASIPPAMKTISIPLFENNASQVVPRLSASFTEELKRRVRSQSKLAIVAPNATADGTLEGTISDYSITPTAVEGNNLAGMLRLSIEVKVKYTNALKQEDGFDQTFKRYVDFAPPVNNSVEQARIEQVCKLLAEDIFNRAFANW